MAPPDLINGTLEFVCSIMLWLDVRAVWRARGAAGVSIGARVFFWFWSVWNLWWYPHLGQYISAAGAVAVMLPQTLWLFLLVSFHKRTPRV